MLNLLKNHRLSGLLVCICLLGGIFAAGLWSSPFPISDYDNAGVLFRLLIQNGIESVIASPYRELLVFTIVVITGVFQTYIINSFDMLYKRTWIPLFFFVSINLIFSQGYYLSPSLFFLVIMTFVLRRFLLLDNATDKVTGYLDIGFFMGLAFLFDLNTVFFIPFLILSFLVTGFFSFRRLLVFFTAFAIPAYFLFVICYAMGGGEFFMQNIWRPIAFGLDLDFINTIEWPKWFVLGMLLFFLIISGIEMQANYYKNTLMTRRAHQFIFLMLLAGTLSVLIGFSKFYSVFNYFALTINIFASYYLIKNKKNIIRELLFWFYIVSIVLSNYLTSF